MKTTQSLKGNYAFRRLYTKGKSSVQPAVVLYCRKNGARRNRLGLTVGTKVGKAVVRNRVRRRLREIYRLHEGEFRQGWDLVVVARSRAAEETYRELEAQLLRAAGRLGLLAP
ncbi:MAG: ribonuclease P protein component [Oscillospiraceae bacterium]|nr:ribonuclease P protein component [Oscillospiraceae bacterium]